MIVIVIATKSLVPNSCCPNVVFRNFGNRNHFKSIVLIGYFNIVSPPIAISPVMVAIAPNRLLNIIFFEPLRI